MPALEPLLQTVTTWAMRRTEIAGVALVGSWARGTAGPSSDVVLMFLTPNSLEFRESFAWLAEINWLDLGVAVDSYSDADYGLVWSRHVKLSDGTRLEFTFAHPSWAATYPCDAGTRSVVSGGC